MTDATTNEGDDQGLMLLSPERICHLGRPGLAGEGALAALRAFGALTLYWAPDRPFRLCRDGRCWETCRVALVSPYQPHRIDAGGNLFGAILMEPERLSGVGLPGLEHAETLIERLRAGHALLRDMACDRRNIGGLDVDGLLFGATLEPRHLDRRVEQALDHLRGRSGRQRSAAECACLVGLSISRFLHLFKQETGIPFRKLCAWKRARSLLYHVNRDASLTDIALDIGYPDSTHFSHSIRRTYGLTPSDIVAGSRRLTALRQQHTATSINKQ